MINLVLAAMLLFVQPAHSAGETYSLTASGLAHVKTVSEKVGKALAFAWSVLGGGYDPSKGDGRFIIPFHNGISGMLDEAVIPTASVSPTLNPQPSSPAACDMFGYCGKAVPTGIAYSQRTVHLFHDPGQGCGPTAPLTTVDQVSGSCNGGVVSAVQNTAYVYTGQWYHPRCSCNGACSIGSAGCPYTAESPCTVYGTGEDREYVETLTYCADPGETATSMPYPNATGLRPAGEFQPEVIASADISAGEAAKTQIAAAKSFLENNVAPEILNNLSSGMGNTYRAISDGSIALNTPTVLTPGEYTYPVGSAAASGGSCSTCAAVSPSSAPLQNVWIQNQQLHVWIDNPPTAAAGSSSITINVSSVVTLGDSDTLAISTFSVPADTETLAGVYAEFVASRSTNALMGLLSNLTVVVSSGAPSFDPNLCFPVPERFGGPQCVNIDADGKFSALVFLLKWSVISSAVVAAYFIIYG